MEEQNGLITHYVVTITNLNDGVEIEHNLLNTSLVVSGLDPHTEYEVYVRSATAAGTGPPTSSLSVHTFEDGKCCVLLFVPLTLCSTGTQPQPMDQQI